MLNKTGYNSEILDDANLFSPTSAPAGVTREKAKVTAIRKEEEEKVDKSKMTTTAAAAAESDDLDYIKNALNPPPKPTAFGSSSSSLSKMGAAGKKLENHRKTVPIGFAGSTGLFNANSISQKPAAEVHALRGDKHYGYLKLVASIPCFTSPDQDARGILNRAVSGNKFYATKENGLVRFISSKEDDIIDPATKSILNDKQIMVTSAVVSCRNTGPLMYEISVTGLDVDIVVSPYGKVVERSLGHVNSAVMKQFATYKTQNDQYYEKLKAKIDAGNAVKGHDIKKFSITQDTIILEAFETAFPNKTIFMDRTKGIFALKDSTLVALLQWAKTSIEKYNNSQLYRISQLGVIAQNAHPAENDNGKAAFCSPEARDTQTDGLLVEIDLYYLIDPGMGVKALSTTRGGGGGGGGGGRHSTSYEQDDYYEEDDIGNEGADDYDGYGDGGDDVDDPLDGDDDGGDDGFNGDSNFDDYDDGY
jgi:hypothetical protein